MSAPSHHLTHRHITSLNISSQRPPSQVNIRARTFKKALDVGAAYKIHTQAVLIRAAMIKANMQVRERPLHCSTHASSHPPPLCAPNIKCSH